MVQQVHTALTKAQPQADCCEKQKQDKPTNYPSELFQCHSLPCWHQDGGWKGAQDGASVMLVIYGSLLASNGCGQRNVFEQS